MSAPVLIVGAGPTGLTMAAELLRRGVSVRLVDKLDAPAPNSRAMVVHARSMETFERMGAVERFLAAGKAAVGVTMYDDGEKAAHVALGQLSRETAYPFVYLISQDQTEHHLCAHLAALGGRVERAVALTGLEQGASGVRATLKGADGQEEQAFFSYVIGCDGAHSTVRHLCGIPFEGAAYPEAFYLADCTVEGPLTQDTLNFCISKHGFLVFFPFVHKQSYRVIVVNEAGFHPTGETPTLADFQEFADRVTKGRLKLSRPEWLARFRLHHLAAARFRQGRCFLAGDAAHIHSPAGGQGMNTGIQDAFNLAWKLAAVLGGSLSEAALDTYSEERRPVAERLLASTDKMFQVMAHNSPSSRRMIRLFAPMALNTVARSATAQRLAMSFITQLGIRYEHPSLLAEVAAERSAALRLTPGRRLPDSPMQSVDTHDPVRLHQVLAREEWSLLLFCLSYSPQSLAASAEPWRDKLSAAIGKELKVRPIISRGAHGVDGEGCLIDTGRAFAKLCKLKSPALVLVRPDGYVGWSTSVD